MAPTSRTLFLFLFFSLICTSLQDDSDPPPSGSDGMLIMPPPGGGGGPANPPGGDGDGNGTAKNTSDSWSPPEFDDSWSVYEVFNVTQYWRTLRYNVSIEVTWNYSTWYTTWEKRLSEASSACSVDSIVQVENAIVSNLFEALGMDLQSRRQSCSALKSSIRLEKTVLVQCEGQEEEDDEENDDMWSSASPMSMALYASKIHVGEFGTIQRIICSIPFEDSSEMSNDTQTCELGMIRDIVLYVMSLERSWQDPNACSDFSKAAEAFEQLLEPCPSATKYALALLASQLENARLVLCTPPTCNIQYADMCLRSSEMDLEEMSQMMNPASWSLTQAQCKNLKMVLSCVTNSTIDCKHSIYSSVSSRFEHLQATFRRFCADMVVSPKPCVASPEPVEPDFGKLVWNFGASLLFNQSTICQVARTYKADDQYLEAFCPDQGGEDNEDRGLYCVATKCSGNADQCDETYIEECMDNKVCYIMRDKDNNVKKQSCQPHSTCSGVPSEDGRKYCCDDFNLCNAVDESGETVTCECNSAKAVVEIKKLPSDTGCITDDAVLAPLLTSIRGCPMADRDELVKNVSCPILKGRMLNQMPCGNVCPTLDQVTTACTSVPRICSQDAANCMAVAVLSCTSKEKAKLIKAVKDWMTNDSCDVDKFLANAEPNVFSSSVSGSSDNEMDENSIAIEKCIKTLMTPQSVAFNVTLKNVTACFSSIKTDLPVTQRVKTFLSYLQPYIDRWIMGQSSMVQKSTSETNCNDTVCVTTNTSETNIMSCGANGLTAFLKGSLQAVMSGKRDSTICSTFKSESAVKAFFTCGDNQIASTVNITAAFGLICQETIESSKCNINASRDCFGKIIKGDRNIIITDFEDMEKCVLRTVSNCSGNALNVSIETVRSLAAAFGFSYPYTAVSEGSCGCDPAGAVSCIMDVHHMAKQATPDWEGLCPRVKESEVCAKQHVADCDECKKSTVLEIVSKLNEQLDEVCEEPPESECKSFKAMACIDDLSALQENSEDYSDESICLKINVARLCVKEESEECDDVTILSLKKELEEVVSKFDVECEEPEDPLAVCVEIFKDRVYSVFGMDMDQLWEEVQNEDSEIWKEMHDLCDDVDLSWSCVRSSLSTKREGTKSYLVKLIMEALYETVQKVCKPPKEPLQCYTCQGNGQKSCDDEEVETCKANEVCQTITEVKDDETTVKSKGCKPRPACKPGCKKDKCTYCCKDNLCNDLDDGPIEGACDLTALAACVLDVSAEFVSGENFTCGSVAAGLGCINRQRAECELGGSTAIVDSLASLDVQAQLDFCLIEEAVQTCEAAPVITTCSYVGIVGSQMRDDELCKIVAANRERKEKAMDDCTDEEYEQISDTQDSLEALVGNLNCTEEFYFVIDSDCEPISALDCAKNDDGSEPDSLTCEQLGDIGDCMREKVKGCKTKCQAFPAQMKFDELKSLVPESDNCDVEEELTEPDLPLKDVSECLDKFSEDLMEHPIKNINNATARLQECLYEVSPEEILALSITDRIVLEAIVTIADKILALKVKIEASAEITATCMASLNAVVSSHLVNTFTLPFLPLDQRHPLCSLIDAGLEALSSCDANIISDQYELLDTFREQFIIGFCPEIKPIPRCLISRAEECFSRFTAYFDLYSNKNLCIEASAFVECAINYTQSCEYDELVSFRKQALFAVDYISQSCVDIELLQNARCTLLGRMQAAPNCDLPSILECSNSASDTCSDREAHAACLVEKVGTCLPDQIKSSPLNIAEELSALSECRSSPVDLSYLSTTCNVPPYSCDADNARNCLVDLMRENAKSGADLQANLLAAKQCLDENYYCFASVMSLINRNITAYAELVVYVLEITPQWNKLESSLLIQLLTLPSYVNRFFEENMYVSLDLWDICLRLDQVMVKIQNIQKAFPNTVLPAAKHSVANLKYTIMKLCDNLGEVAEELTFPEDMEEPKECKQTQIKAHVNVLMSRAVSEFYTEQNIVESSVCSLYRRVNQTLWNTTVDILGLNQCSSGFQAQVKFSMKAVQTVLGNFCNLPEIVVKHCDVSMIKQCVSTLYNGLMDLGKNQSKEGLCRLSEKTEMCVQTFSYRCDRYTMSRIDWMYMSVKKAVQEECMIVEPTQMCEMDEEEEEEHDAKMAVCDTAKASKCSCHQYRNIADPLLSNETKCRALKENQKCIQDNLEGCEDELPKMYLVDDDKVDAIKQKLGCAEEEQEDEDKEPLGCREGCWLGQAEQCFEIFTANVPERMWGMISQSTCSYINDLRVCISKNTMKCRKDESEYITRRLEIVLGKFPGHQETCIDILQCAHDFDILVRQIADLEPEDVSYDDSKDKSMEKGSKEDSQEKDSEKESMETDSKDDSMDNEQEDSKSDSMAEEDSEADSKGKDKEGPNADSNMEEKEDSKADSKVDEKEDSKANSTAGEKEDSKADSKMEETEDSKADSMADEKDDSKTDSKAEEKEDSKAESKGKDEEDSKADSTETEEEDSKSGSKEEDTKGSSKENSMEGAEMDLPELNVLCAKIRIAWKCLKNGLEILPKQKRNILKPMYYAIWETVEQKCDETSELTCHYCKNEDDSESCETEVETCKNSKQACMIKKSYTNNDIKYMAGCTNVNACYNEGNAEERTYCCTSNLCNVAANISSASDVEPETCKWDYSMKCALDFSTRYISSDSLSCSDATANLACIEKFGSSCTKSGSILEVSSQLFLQLASTTCVINAESGDCYSLAVDSMQTILSNAYISEGNSACVALKETTLSVDQLITSGKCSEAGRVSLRQVLNFVTTIVGATCDEKQCEAKYWRSLMQENNECSDKIFDGIKNIYKAYKELAKEESERDCSMIAVNARNARQCLNNCNLPAFVTAKLDELDASMRNSCQVIPVIELPKVCENACQTDVIISYAQEVAAVIEMPEKQAMASWYLSEVEQAYTVYTAGCISIQQRDVVNSIMLSLGSVIDMVKAEDSEFEFMLEIKRDIYYESTMCEMRFQSEIKEAFATDDQERACKAITALKSCDWNLPDLVMDFIMSPTKYMLSALEESGLCEDSGLDRRRRAEEQCDIKKLTNLIFQISIPPAISSAPLETRNKICQDLDKSMNEAAQLVNACGDGISRFQITMYNSFKLNVERQNELLCPVLHFEEKKCNLELVQKCQLEFNLVCSYATVEPGALCRRAKFALECVHRFSQNCSTDDSKAQAIALQKATWFRVKEVVGNTCPMLTSYLYCNGSLSTYQAACQFDQAQQCAKEAVFDFLKMDNPEYCETLSGKVACVRQNALGCERSQITALGWPSNAKNGFCKIENVELKDICVSSPVCNVKPVIDCFATTPIDCPSLQKALSCRSSYLMANPQCESSLVNIITTNFLAAYYSDLLASCGQAIVFQIPEDYPCLETLLTVVEQATGTKQGSAAEVMKYIYTELETCLDNAEGNTVIVSAIKDILVQLNIYGSQVKLLNYTGSDGLVFEDSTGCSYTKAKACLNKQIFTILGVQLLTGEERTMFCEAWTDNMVRTCITAALQSCPQDDQTWFLSINSVVSNAVSTLGICASPQVCLVSEAFECVNKFGAIIASYERNGDEQALCVGRINSQACVQSFVAKCDAKVAKPSNDAFMTLYQKVEPICKDVELPPPPICPLIPERNRVCRLGNAFRCLTAFNTKILQGGGSLIWRQQCMDMQAVMVCVATNTTSCDTDNEDVQIIRESLDKFVMAAGYQCPWLSDDLCTLEEPCPVATAGCEVDLERGLINREKTICKLKEETDQCVLENTATCTMAQKKQADTVIEQKMKAVGFPKILSCDGDSIDGCIYSLLSIIENLYLDNIEDGICSVLSEQYNCINSRFSNPEQSSYRDLARSLIDKVTSKVETGYCTMKKWEGCKASLSTVIKEVSFFIKQLLLVTDFSSTSFCAQSQAILQTMAGDCNDDFYNVISTSEVYQTECTVSPPSCDAAVKDITKCIANIGSVGSMSCPNKLKAAMCITSSLPANCSFNSTLLNVSGCENLVVLQASGDQSAKTFISEAGLYTTFSWKYLAGSRNFKIKLSSKAVNTENVPRCLEGSKVDEPIPQIYTEMNPQSLAKESDEIVFRIYARQDYRVDGAQSVEVKFTVIPFKVEKDAEGEETHVDMPEQAFELPTFKIEIDDRDVKNSMCSSVNDPHLRSFDGLKYNNMGTGNFILYRHKKKAIAVVVQYKQCSAYGSCNCGASVYAGKSRVTFDLCSEDSPFISFKSESGADTLAQQQLSVFSNKDLKTYYVTLQTGTIVKVIAEKSYMNIYIMPSAEDIGSTQGLCGVYDGDGYNDFELPDQTVYKTSADDSPYNILSPNNFNQAWKISTGDMDDLSKIYFQGVEVSTDVMKTYCYSWDRADGKNSTECGTLSHFGPCGFVSGENIMAKLLEVQQQVRSTDEKRRKKRQAVPEAPDVIRNETGWPTPSGWTREKASEICLKNLYEDSKPLLACKEAVIALEEDVDFSVDDALTFCIDDIRLSDGPDWIEGALGAASQLCSQELNQNPQYQNNGDSSDLAIAFLDMTCSPYDCSGHGKCSRGTCICDSDYVGTDCSTHKNSLKPPTLTTPSEGVHMCEISDSSDCAAIYISGKNFVSSNMLSCHLREIEVTDTGVQTLTSVKETIVKGELISKDQVRCDLGSKSVVKRTLQVSVSNDGTEAYPNYQRFIAYDPMCHQCDFYTCRPRTDVCFLGNKCVPEGQYSVYTNCQYCDLNKPTEWTVRTDVEECKKYIEKDKEPGKPETNEILTPALIGAGCALLVLLLVLIIGLFIYMRRREAIKRRNRAHIRFNNPAYQEEPPFYGQPVPAYQKQSPPDSLGRHRQHDLA